MPDHFGSIIHLVGLTDGLGLLVLVIVLGVLVYAVALTRRSKDDPASPPVLILVKGEFDQYLSDELNEANDVYNKLQKRIEHLAYVQGKVWNLFDEEQTNNLRPFDTRTPIVSIFSLQSGNGKSLIADKLARAFVKDRRVLLIDVDFEQGVTSKFLPTGGKAPKKSHVRRVFERSCVRPEAMEIDGVKGLHLWAADSKLATVDHQLLIRWLLQEVEDDIRLRLRSVLHSDECEKNYDMILIDCPPLLTTGTINALACSDLVIIPTLLDDESTKRLKKLVKWIGAMKDRITLDPRFKVGIVPNKFLGMVTNPVQFSAPLNRLPEVPELDEWIELMTSFSKKRSDFVCFFNAIFDLKIPDTDFVTEERVQAMFSRLATQIDDVLKG